MTVSVPIADTIVLCQVGRRLCGGYHIVGRQGYLCCWQRYWVYRVPQGLEFLQSLKPHLTNSRLKLRRVILLWYAEAEAGSLALASVLTESIYDPCHALFGKAGWVFGVPLINDR